MVFAYLKMLFLHYSIVKLAQFILFFPWILLTCLPLLVIFVEFGLFSVVHCYLAVKYGLKNKTRRGKIFRRRSSHRSLRPSSSKEDYVGRNSETEPNLGRVVLLSASGTA